MTTTAASKSSRPFPPSPKEDEGHTPDWETERRKIEKLSHQCERPSKTQKPDHRKDNTPKPHQGHHNTPNAPDRPPQPPHRPDRNPNEEPYSTNGKSIQGAKNRASDGGGSDSGVAHFSVAPPAEAKADGAKRRVKLTPLYYREGVKWRQLHPVGEPSYIMDRAPYTKPAIRYVNEVCRDAGLNAGTIHFVKHVLHSWFIQQRGGALDEGGYVSVPANVRTFKIEGELYRRGARRVDTVPEGAEALPESDVTGRGGYGFRRDERTADADLEAVKEAGILSVREYSIIKGRCTAYKPSGWLLEGFLEEQRRYMKQYPESTTRYNLFDLDQKIVIGRSPKTNDRSDDNGKLYPQVILDGMDAVQERVFNWKAVQRKINDLYDKKESMERLLLDELPEVAKPLIEAGVVGGTAGCGDMGLVREAVRERFGEGSKQWQALRDYEKARGRWRSAHLALEVVKGQSPEPQENGAMWRYSAAYTASSTGRITEKHGGFQNAPTEVKAASIKGLERARNYDVKSCHDTALRILFSAEHFDVDDAGYFDDYERKDAGDGDAKKAAADYIGCTRKTFKSCHHALKQQASPITPFGKNDERIVPDIYAYLRDDHLVDDPHVALKKFRKLTARLRTALKEWREKLEVRAWKEAVRNQHGVYFKNAVGMRFPLHKYQDPNADKAKLTPKGRRRLAAHVLQGMEAYFVHTLAALLKEKDGVDVIANEHDGLITLGDVPNTAVQEAQRITGYDGMEFVPKPIA